MIGWYVHHHGLGHAQRFQAVAAHLRTPVTALSSLPAPPGWADRWIELPRDDTAHPTHTPRTPHTPGGPVIGDQAAGDPTASGVLHWAPAHHDGLLHRSAAIVGWLATARPALLVCDVSVEVALLARLAGIPVAVVAMQGERTDRPHRAAYDLASRLLAPWPAGLPHGDLLPRWHAKTSYVGAFSRFDGREARANPAHLATADPALSPILTPADDDEATRRVLLLWGTGGSDVTDADVEAARQATPGWQWTLRRPPIRDGDVWPDLLAADVVVVHGGQNAVAEVAAARRPAVVVAQRRPHAEQEHRVRTLRAAGLAVGLDRWPAPAEWPAHLAAAVEVGGHGWRRWSPGDGAQRMACQLDSLAAARAVA